ncbi:MAG: 1,4-beta-xylanase [Clostridia bacterium]|nr:1,4-beta-xylanase [Clostridia bacterium]
MEKVKGITFGTFAARGSFKKEEARSSLMNLKHRTGANTIILVPNGLQDTAQSEEIDFSSPATIGDEELCDMIRLAKTLGLRVFLKPTVNCKNGTWRAFINFFDNDVHCEPKWCNWFQSYTAFMLHFAKIAQQEKCDMFIAGCEMVMAERREKEWRTLIDDIRNEYDGLVSYNTDKYQEEHVKWWDCVDVISSSGYYPLNDWEQELDRIEQTVKKYQKPFFFAEVGCMSTTGSSKVPNKWCLDGSVNLKEQAEWYKAMFTSCEKRTWINGYGVWEWGIKQYKSELAKSDRRYDIYGKPAEEIVRQFYQ